MPPIAATGWLDVSDDATTPTAHSAAHSNARPRSPATIGPVSGLP